METEMQRPYEWGTKAMRVLIVDDEPPVQDALARILRSREDVESFDSAEDAAEAIDKLDRIPYDVILLDISMPEASGVDFLDRLNQNNRVAPSVIFMTAQEEQAIAVFEKRAVDYILKPFSIERVTDALNRVAQRTASQRDAKLLEMLPFLLKNLRPRSRKIAIKAKGRILFIDPGEVISIHAEGNYVLLQKESGSYLMRESISYLAKRLDPYGFIRIHRSVLINGAYVEELQPHLTGEYGLRVKGGKQYTVTRTYKKNLKALAEVWIGSGTFLPE